MKKTFGATIRALREQKQVSLRKFAELAGISPTFQSKMERDEFAPPSEQVVRRMAQILEQDEDEFLALAGKISSDLPTIIREEPEEMAALLRTASGLSPEALEKLRRHAERLKRQT